MDKTRVDELVTRVAALPAEDRGSFLDRVCDEDSDLRNAVTEALAVETEKSSRLADIDLIPGQDIGPYRLLERIGEGGMGTVFLAEQRKPVERKVALKVVKLGMDTKEVLARFEAERQALALMSHPNVAVVYDAGATDTGRPYFAMEYVPGISITDYCDRKRLSIRDRIKLFAQVCDGVQHAHQKGIIHRDLKPGNILTMERSGRPAVKIIDFGVAKSTQRRLTEHTLHTRLGEFIGTPNYTSPEQAARDQMDVDTRTDVYSLGVVLYELLVGSLPFEASLFTGKSLPEIRRIIREVDPPTPAAKFESLGSHRVEIAHRRSLDTDRTLRRLKGELSWIVMRALEKDRDDRYPSASALAADIFRYLDHEPVEARAQTRAYRSRKFIRRHRLGVTIGASIAVLLIGVTVSSTILSVAAEDARIDAERRREQAENLISFMLGDLRQRLTEVGRLDILDSVATKALEYFAGLPAKDLSDDVLALRAQALRQQGEVQFDRGDFDAAMRLFEESLLVADALLKRDNTNLDRQYELSQAQFWVGYVHWERGDLAAADRAMRIYHDISVALNAAEPDNQEYQLELGYAFNNLAALSHRRGDLAAALGYGQQHIDISLTRFSLDRDDVASRDSLAEAYSLHGRMLRDSGRLVESEDRFVDYLELVDAANGADPENTRWLEAKMLGHHWIAAVSLDQGNSARAQTHYLVGEELADQLVAIEPGNAFWQGERAHMLTVLSGLEMLAGSSENSQKHQAAARELVDDQLAKEPANLMWLWIKVELDLSVARIHLESGESELAQSAARLAFERATRIITNDSDSMENKRLLADSLILNGRIAQKLGDKQSASKWWVDTLNSLGREVLVSSNPALLDPLIRASLYLGRSDEVQSQLARLRAANYSHPLFVSALQDAGLQQSRDE